MNWKTFVALLWRDARVARRNIVPLLLQTFLQPMMFVFIFGRVMVGSGYWNFYGNNTFGITLLPMLIGIGLLFFSGRSTIGWLLTAGGALFIFAGVIANLHIDQMDSRFDHTA